MTKGVIQIKNANQVRLVSNLEKSKAYYRDALGFEVDDWGHATRSNIGFLLEQADHMDDVRPNKRPSRNVTYPFNWAGPKTGRDTYAYMDWDVIELLYSEMKSKGAIIHTELEVEDEGFQLWKEFSVKDLDNYVIVFAAGKLNE
jgi:lactoylglutathione lyase